MINQERALLTTARILSVGKGGQKNRHPFLSQGQQPVSWTGDLCSHAGPWFQKGTMLGLMFCYWYLEILNNFLK